MAYTEKRSIRGTTYFYRVLSVRNGDKVSKKRIYLGSDLSSENLLHKERKADEQLFSHKFLQRERNLEKLKKIIVPVLIKNKIKKAGIFGSYARGEQKKNSDMDIIVQPPPGMGLKFVHLQLTLEEKLKRKVDLITYDFIHPLLRERILHEEIRIL